MVQFRSYGNLSKPGTFYRKRPTYQSRRQRKRKRISRRIIRSALETKYHYINMNSANYTSHQNPTSASFNTVYWGSVHVGGRQGTNFYNNSLGTANNGAAIMPLTIAPGIGPDRWERNGKSIMIQSIHLRGSHTNQNSTDVKCRIIIFQVRDVTTPGVDTQAPDNNDWSILDNGSPGARYATWPYVDAFYSSEHAGTYKVLADQVFTLGRAAGAEPEEDTRKRNFDIKLTSGFKRVMTYETAGGTGGVGSRAKNNIYIMMFSDHVYTPGAPPTTSVKSQFWIKVSYKDF